MGLNPQIPLAQRNEGRDVLNPIGIQMLQLKPIVVQQPLEESVGRSREPTLVEGDEGDDIAVGQRWLILATRYNPLHCRGPCTEKALLN